MILKKKALLYDIANLAYIIADTGETDNHSLHQVRDICEEGNIDRVSRVLGLAYSQILSVLFPILQSPKIEINRDQSAQPHDYEISFRCDGALKYRLTSEKKLEIKETCHEYMVCMVLADWLGVVYPVAADVWRFRAEKAMEALRSKVTELVVSFTGGLRRSLSPF